MNKITNIKVLQEDFGDSIVNVQRINENEYIYTHYIKEGHIISSLIVDKFYINRHISMMFSGYGNIDSERMFDAYVEMTDEYFKVPSDI